MTSGTKSGQKATGNPVARGLAKRDLIPVIGRLSRQSKSVDEAIEQLQLLLAGEIGGAALQVETLENGTSPLVAQSVSALMDSREFPFRGLYTAPLIVGNRKVGRLVACFGSLGASGRSLATLTTYVARQLSEILSRTSRTVTSLTVPGPVALRKVTS